MVVKDGMPFLSVKKMGKICSRSMKQPRACSASSCSPSIPERAWRACSKLCSEMFAEHARGKYYRRAEV
uniref:Uncharacterized protein n=1 Tax=Romanomermis culicivorax TaxID=13658 RepID=A0A915I0I7_ROMCU